MTALPLSVFRKTRHLQAFLDDRGEILVRDVLHTGPAHQTRGEDVVLIGFLGLLNAVGGHEDGTGNWANSLI
jgi:hypothetical protein